MLVLQRKLLSGLGRMLSFMYLVRTWMCSLIDMCCAGFSIDLNFKDVVTSKLKKSGRHCTESGSHAVGLQNKKAQLSLWITCHSLYNFYNYCRYLVLYSSSCLLLLQLKNLMVVGVDTYHDSAKKGRSVGAFVASMNKTLTRYYSNCGFQSSHEELQNNLCTFMRGMTRAVPMSLWGRVWEPRLENWFEKIRCFGFLKNFTTL